MTSKRLTGDRNQCPTCHDFFNSTVAFDRHRTGSFGTASDPNARRRCMTPDEMRAKGMAVNASGFWILRPMSDAAVRAVASVDDANDPVSLNRDARTGPRPLAYTNTPTEPANG